MSDVCTTTFLCFLSLVNDFNWFLREIRNVFKHDNYYREIDLRDSFVRLVDDSLKTSRHLVIDIVLNARSTITSLD